MVFEYSPATQFSVHLLTAIHKDPLTRRIAENTSRYSSNPSKIKVSVHSAQEAIACILALVCITPERGGFIRENLLRELHRMAENYNYEGKWEIVRILSELQTLTPYVVMSVISEYFSKEDFYGNLSKLSLELIKRMEVVDYYKYHEHKVKYPKRKRGYHDKGSLRSPEKWLPKDVWLGMNPEKESREKYVYRPRNPYYWLNEKNKGDEHLVQKLRDSNRRSET